MLYYVQIVREDGTLGRLFGPASWDDAIAKVKAIVVVAGINNHESEKAIDIDGAYSYSSGGGVYIVQAEDINAPLSEEGGGGLADVVNISTGTMEWEDDGPIRYVDTHGNTGDLWHPGDVDYDRYKNDYFPEHEVEDANDEE